MAMDSRDLRHLLAGCRWDGSVVGRVKLAAGTTYRARRLGWELLVLEQGTVQWRHRRSAHQVACPSLLLLGPGGEEERCYQDTHCHCYLGLRLQAQAQRVLAGQDWWQRPISPGSPAIALARLAVSRAQAGAQTAVDAHLRSLLTLLMDGVDVPSPSPRWSPAVAATLDTIRQAWSSGPVQDLELDQLAAAAGVTRSSLCRAFARDVGMAPMAYQRALRIRIAVHRLRHSQQALKRIAAETGFRDARHLGRSLRETCGRSASDLRRQPQIPVPIPAGLDLLLWNEVLRG